MVFGYFWSISAEAFGLFQALQVQANPKQTCPMNRHTHPDTYVHLLPNLNENIVCNKIKKIIIETHTPHRAWWLRHSAWLTHVMAGPSGSVTASYVTRSLRLTSGVMDMVSGYPSNTTSACLTLLPVEYKATVPSEYLKKILYTPQKSFKSKWNIRVL